MIGQLPPFIKIPEAQLENLLPLIFDKDYSSSLLSFIDNPARTLNYWAAEPNILPLGDEGGKWRRYSFFDMIWLLIVQELREFSIEKPVIAQLKSELLTPVNYEEILGHIEKAKKELEASFKKDFGWSDADIQSYFETIDEKQKIISGLRELQATKLYTDIFYSITQQKVVRYLINKRGNHVLFGDGTNVTFADIEGESGFGTSYICINLTNIVTRLLVIQPIKDELKQNFFSDEEWQLLQIIKKEKPLQIKISYKGEEIDLVDITKRKKIKIEARLNEILLKKAYETIKIKTVKGNVIDCISTETRKLKK